MRGPVGQLRLDRLAGGDIARVEDEPADVGVVQEVGEQRLEVMPGAVARAQAIGEGGLGARGGGAGGEGGAQGGQVVRVDEVEVAEGERLAIGVAEQTTQGGVAVAPPAVGIDDGDDIGGVFEEGATPPLAVAQGRLGLVAGGDVLDHRDGLLECAIVSAQGGEGDADPDPGVVASPPALLDDVAVAPPDPDLVPQGEAVWQIIGVCEGLWLDPAQFLVVVPEQGLEGGVVVAEVAAGIGDGEAAGCVGEDGTELPVRRYRLRQVSLNSRRGDPIR